MTVPRAPLTCSTRIYEFPASDIKRHVLHLLKEDDLITRFEVKNAHVVLVLSGWEVADITEKCVIPVIGLLYGRIELHVYPLNHDKAVRVSVLKVLLHQGRDRDEIRVARSLLCGSFSVDDGLVPDRDCRPQIKQHLVP